MSLALTRCRLIAVAAALMVVGGLGLTGCESSNSTAVQTTHNKVDVGFLAEMAVHHDQALTLAQIALAKGVPEVHSIAMSVLVAQLEEIGRMRGWLHLWGHPELPTSSDMEWTLGVEDVEAAMYVALCRSSDGMPGLASADELNRLRQMQGEDFVAYFLQLMTRHHQGAIPMARFASLHAANPMVQSLARRMVIDQGNEIARMVTILKQMGREPLPTPLGAARLQS